MYAKLKKKYGQNFLIDSNITNKIINLIDDINLDILEIGPGNGKLSEKILKSEGNISVTDSNNNIIGSINKDKIIDILFEK